MDFGTRFESKVIELLTIKTHNIMVKQYNIEYFDAAVNGVNYSFKAYTTDTRNGFCHTIVCTSHDVRNTKLSYCNRTWERFRYESALRFMLEKFPKEIKEGLTEVLIEGKYKEVSERCDKMFNAFSALHSSLSEENKEKLANSNIIMESEGDMQNVMGVMGLMKIMED